MSAWLTETRANTANGGGLAKALDYTLRRWPSLIRYADTGHLPIDNNPVENTIRTCGHRKEKLAVRWFGVCWSFARPLSKACLAPPS